MKNNRYKLLKFGVVMTLLNEAFKEISNIFIGDKGDLYNRRL
ncbi:hypothetical protein ACMGE5_02920 [Macrococcus equi]